MDSFKAFILSTVRTIAVEYHGYVEEDGIFLAPDTVKLVAEMEEANRQHLIDQSLVTGNKDLFMQLTKG
ncbi:IDEAL domain-containing protein [Solibacillus sp. FSL R7-0668]|uniref:IDEAL domain-containing protein n=1 Tax=Solibacillus sp. FSL R7-0668 TaxID=2921688 RepID=UPI0030F56AB3